MHVATLCDWRVSVYHRAVHGAIYRLSYYFRSKDPKRQLVDKRRSLLHKYRMWRLLSDRSIFVVHIRARHVYCTVNEGLNKPLTENFTFTKTGGQIVIEPKHPNVLRTILQNNNVINITSETDEAYSFIDHGHVYQVPKAIVEQK